MEETLKTDIIDGKMINWEKLSNEEINELRQNAENKEQEIIGNIFKIFESITEE